VARRSVGSCPGLSDLRFHRDIGAPRCGTLCGAFARWRRNTPPMRSPDRPLDHDVMRGGRPRTSLLASATYPTQETSGTGFFVYALAWGINNGARRSIGSAVENGWRGLVGSLRPDGKTGWVQPIAAGPQHISAEVYGVGAFLLAGS
jgi:Glycosyl Hydrolase Family 88